MSVNAIHFKVGDKVLVEARIEQIDANDEAFPLLLEIGGEFIWSSPAPVVAHLTTPDSKGPANDD